ncbi:DNAJ domain-containing [Cryptosporidium canis]|uniref:DNAJ domain-containing n=1 Tax=Cryptosporidium canis TaxID=195482 RepID=A0ABQ8P4P4_9CRYT|nr:DNAJ domain-containing [Cryptosporidium canis]KAJ1611066.1 DNAJ domain-containing [Cryptosporidium canis]
MDSNREEADRCVALARKAIQGGDLDKARRLLEKANRMYPSPSVAEMLKGLGSRDPGSPGDQRGQGRTGHHSRHSHGASSERPSPRSSHSPSRGRRRNEEEGNRGAQAGRSGHHSASSSSSSESSEGLCKRILRAKNFYDTLGVSKDADDAAIKKAYKKLALQLHPDKCKAPSAEEAFKRIAMAFQTLSDAEKRKNYDAFGENGPPMHSASGDVRYYQYHQGDGFLTPEDLFRMFFGGVPAEDCRPDPGAAGAADAVFGHHGELHAHSVSGRKAPFTPTQRATSTPSSRPTPPSCRSWRSRSKSSTSPGSAGLRREPSYKTSPTPSTTKAGASSRRYKTEASLIAINLNGSETSTQASIDKP